MSTEVTEIENFYKNDVSKLEDLSYEMISVAKPAQTEEGQIDGIEILLNMAKTGKIDPWNIDLTDLADKYLLEFAKLKTVNLQYTGRTILFLSVLLKLKSNVLEGIDVMQFEPENEEEQEFYDDEFQAEYDDEPINRNNVISIDEVLQRRTSIRLNRNRVVTLKDLIRQLEFYEQLDKKMALKNQLERQRKRVKSFARYTAKDIIDMSHEDYIKDAIPKMRENLDNIFKSESRVEIDALTLLGFERVTAYMALLFISADSEYELTQEKFYEKLFVEKGNKITVAV